MENNVKKFVPGDIVRYADGWRREEEKDILSIVVECYNSDEAAYIRPTQCNMFIVPTEHVKYYMIELVQESPFRRMPMYGTERNAGKMIVWKSLPGSDSDGKLYLLKAFPSKGKYTWTESPALAMRYGPKMSHDIMEKLQEEGEK